MKKILLTSAAAALLIAAQANAAQYQITYSYTTAGKYTSSQPLDPSLVPDPTNALNPGNHGSTLTDLAPIAVSGTGILDTTAGTILLNPINFEVRVTSGSYGFVGWSQQMNGSFVGNAFNMAGNATVLGGSLVCENPASSSCAGSGGVGAAPTALRPPQTYPDPSEDEFGDPIPGGPLTLTNIVFTSLGTGGTGQYLFQDDAAPAYADTTINFAIGNEIVSQVPVPAAAWLFGSGLLGLAGVGRKRR